MACNDPFCTVRRAPRAGAGAAGPPRGGGAADRVPGQGAGTAPRPRGPLSRRGATTGPGAGRSGPGAPAGPRARDDPHPTPSRSPPPYGLPAPAAVRARRRSAGPQTGRDHGRAPLRGRSAAEEAAPWGGLAPRGRLVQGAGAQAPGCALREDRLCPTMARPRRTAPEVAGRRHDVLYVEGLDRRPQSGRPRHAVPSPVEPALEASHEPAAEPSQGPPGRCGAC
jgi:hypothetical protein